MSSNTQNKVVAFIPARAGSVRVPDKNIRMLAGHPMMAYSIVAAINADIFSDVIVCTDSAKYADIAMHYGAEVPFLRSTQISGEKSPDIEWVKFALAELQKKGRYYEYFSILRPTSPFRQPETIKRAWSQMKSNPKADTLRAIEKCTQHPGKMWKVENDQIKPIMPYEIDGQPWHSNQYSNLPEIWVQNASLEIARTSVVDDFGKITGDFIIPFFTKAFEGHDINSEDDFEWANTAVEKDKAILPSIDIQAFTAS